MDRNQIADHQDQPQGERGISLRKASLPGVSIAGCFVLGLSMVGFIGSVGCDDSSPSPPPPAATPPPSPEVRWERFLTDFRRRLASDPGGAFSYGGGDSYYADYSIKSSELIPPQSEKGVYRAKLVIETTSSFTVFNRDETETDTASEESSESSDQDGSSELKEILGVDVATDAGARPSLNAPMQTHEDREETVCELAYVEDRWVLKTELDPETSTFLKAAFRLALERQ